MLLYVSTSSCQDAVFLACGFWPLRRFAGLAKRIPPKPQRLTYAQIPEFKPMRSNTMSIVTAISLTFMSAFSSAVAITGHVVDSSGNPVADAYITYTALDYRLLWAYSDAKGDFFLDSLAKTALAPGIRNQVRVGKTGYSPAYKKFTSYNDCLGDVKIVKIDIEAKVDSLIKVILAHKNAKEILAGQTIMPNENEADLITTRNAAVFLYGLGSNMTWDARRAASDAAQKSAMASTATHVPIPLLIAGDLIHGYTYGLEGGVVFPQNIGLGCTFDPKIVEKCFRVSAIECKAAGFNFGLSPNSDVTRNSKSGRTYESFSEDPAHVSTMVKAAIFGFQGSDVSHPLTVGSCVKHFAGPGGIQDGRQPGVTNTGSDAALRRIHLAPYRAALEAGVCAVMACYNSWKDDGGREIPMHANKELLTNTLKGAMRHDGFILGDYDAHWATEPFFADSLKGLSGNDRRAKLGSLAINAGIDVPYGATSSSATAWAPNAVAAIDKKYLKQERLVDVARRILRVKFRMGLFDTYLFDPALAALIRSPMHKDVAREAVRKSLVCLKITNKALPLVKTAKIHVVGTLADNMGCQAGGWTYGGKSTSWQGDTKKDKPIGTSIYQAIVKQNPGATWSRDENGIPADVDAVVVVTGETPYAETFGEDGTTGWGNFTGVFNKVKSSMTLADMPEGRIIDLVRAKTAAPVVAVLIAGRPMILGTSLDNADVFVCAWLPGSEGEGVADVLFGDYDFTGKLSFTWPKRTADEPLNFGNYGDKDTKATPLFPFGHGLNLSGKQLPAGMY
jgi:beta-glucosidase